MTFASLDAALKSRSLYTRELPQLDLTKNPKSKTRDYIDYLKPADMTGPAMTFVDEKRFGYAFLIEPKVKELGGRCTVQSGVVTVFQRYSFSPNSWVMCATHELSLQIVGAYKERHKGQKMPLEVCMCSGWDVPQSMIFDIVSGKDPDFKLVDPVLKASPKADKKEES